MINLPLVLNVLAPRLTMLLSCYGLAGRLSLAGRTYYCRRLALGGRGVTSVTPVTGTTLRHGQFRTLFKMLVEFA